MHIVIKFLTRRLDGTPHTLTIADGCETFMVTPEDLKILWDAERAINETSHIRCHIEVKE